MIAEDVVKIVTTHLNLSTDVELTDELIKDLKCNYSAIIDILNLLDNEFKINITCTDELPIRTIQDLCDTVTELSKEKHRVH